MVCVPAVAQVYVALAVVAIEVAPSAQAYVTGEGTPSVSDAALVSETVPPTATEVGAAPIESIVGQTLIVPLMMMLPLPGLRHWR